MQRIAHLCKILVGSQAAVQRKEITGIVSMAVTFEHRVEQHRRHVEPADMLCPVQHPQDAVLPDAVVFRRRAAQPQRIDLINTGLVEPHICFSFLAQRPV